VHVPALCGVDQLLHGNICQGSVSDKAEGQGRRWRLKRPLVVKDCQTKPRRSGVYPEMTLMNFDYWGAVNFFAIIIGH
jgi:hypothetical protein